MADPGRLSVAVLDGPLMAPPAGPEGRWAPPAATRAWAALWDRVREIGARLVVVDPAALALDVGGAGYSAAPVGAFIGALRRAAVEAGAAVLIVTHTTKATRAAGVDAGAEAVSGSHAWTDRCRAAVGMAGGELAVWKANYAPTGTVWALEPIRHSSGRPIAYREMAAAGKGGKAAEPATTTNPDRAYV